MFGACDEFLEQIPVQHRTVFAAFLAKMDKCALRMPGSSLMARAMVCLGMMSTNYVFDESFTLGDWREFCENVATIVAQVQNHMDTCEECQARVAGAGEDADEFPAGKHAGQC